jgi:hypothetical protein
MALYSIWPATNGPNTDGGDPGAPINLGHLFQVSVTFWVLKIRFYRGATTITGSPVGRIFTGTAGSKVAGTDVTFTLSGTGWHEATLDTPVQLVANTTYKVVVHFPDNYTASGNFWNIGAGVGGITDGPLTAPDAGGTPLSLGPIQQGSFKYTSDPDLNPDSYFNGGNYWVDLVVTDVEPTNTAVAPLVSAPSTVFSPAVQYVIQANTVNAPSAIFDPTVVLKLQFVSLLLLQTASTIFSPSVQGGASVATGSIADQSRVNMLSNRVLTEPRIESDTDLMVLVLADGLQVLVPKTDASAATHLLRYMMSLRP